MIVEWINSIEALIATCSDPDVVGRLQEVNANTAIENRMTDDYYTDDEEFIEKMPFFVIRESQPTGWDMDSNDTMAGRGAIEVGYFEWANQYLTVPNVQVRNRLSKRYFLEFIDGVIQDAAERNGRNDVIDLPDSSQVTLAPLSRIEIIEPAKRTAPRMRDPDNPHTDFWMMRWRFYIGTVGR